MKRVLQFTTRQKFQSVKLTKTICGTLGRNKFLKTNIIKEAKVSLNKKIMGEYESETGREAIYISNGITRHFLPYVDWLEERLLKLEAQNLKSPNKQSVEILLKKNKELISAWRNDDSVDDSNPSEVYLLFEELDELIAQNFTHL